MASELGTPGKPVVEKADKELKIVPLPNIKDWLPGRTVHQNPLVERCPTFLLRGERDHLRQQILSTASQSRAFTKDFDCFLRAGPRTDLQFDPQKTNALIVTTGGLCPGLNSVIEELVSMLLGTYGSKRVLGVRYGWRGFEPGAAPPIELTQESVRGIHKKGGTIIGTCRGHFKEDLIIDFVRKHDIHQLFVVGGDGSHRAANKLHESFKEKGMGTVVVGIPKTIDNDILFVDKTFGFDSAVERATNVIQSALNEAMSVENGIGLVRVMGRDSGFVARNAALATSCVSACLIPEVNFTLKGEKGLLTWLSQHLEKYGHAVIVISESAGQDLMPGGDDLKQDGLGHNIYKDAPRWLRTQIEGMLKEEGKEGKVFFMDPSYLIRSGPATVQDNIFCTELAQSAVHTAFSGYSGVSVGRIYGHQVVLPIPLITSEPKRVRTSGSVWQRLCCRDGFFLGFKATSDQGTGEPAAKRQKV